MAKKRILALLLACTMIVTSLPTEVFAKAVVQETADFEEDSKDTVERSEEDAGDGKIETSDTTEITDGKESPDKEVQPNSEISETESEQKMVSVQSEITDFTYTALNGTYCQITDYIGTETDVELPSEIDGYIVQSVGDNVFKDNKTLVRVAFPETIETIGNSVFMGCTALTDVSFNEGLVSTGGSTFQGCTSLKKITMPGSIRSIGNSDFSGCTGLTEVNLPEGLTTIYAYAFQNCNGLTRIDIPDSVTTMSARAFYNCANLSEVGYPVGWTKLLDHSYNSDTYWSDGNSYYTSPFEGCSSLKKIEIPEGVTGIPKHAFRYLKSLEEVVLPESLTSIGVYAFDGCSGLTTIKIPQNLKTIGSYAFRGCAGLRNINLNEGLETIKSYAFQNCTGLRNVTIPESITSISGYVFSGCTGLTEVNLPEGLATIYAYAFQNCNGLTRIDIPDSVTTMSARAFYNCANLSEVGYPVGWTKLLDHSYNSDTYWSDGNSYYTSPFEGCSSLKKIEIPEGVTGIPKHAFRSFKSLEEVVLPESLTSIGVYAFDGCSGLATIKIPQNLKTIGSYAFQGCTGLRNINLNEGLGTIESCAFQGCTGLRNVTIPKSITSISGYVFSGCTGLTEVNLPEGLATIYAYAFQNCNGLTRIDIPDSVTTMSARAFYNCANLSEVGYPVGWTKLLDHSYNSDTYWSDGNSYYTSPFEGCSSLKKIEIPEGVTGIPKHAFRYLKSLEEVVLPESLTSIGVYAFDGCSGLTTIKIPQNLKTIGSYAFQGCTGLRNINLNEGLGTIESCAFQGCTGLRNVTIPKSITSISGYVFSGCTGLTEVNLPEGLATIYAYAFQNCNGLTRIDIPDSVTTMSARAFYNCANLSEVGYPVGWTKLLDHSYNSDTYWSGGNSYYTSPFEGCSSLKKIEIPEGVTGIPKHAFRYLKSLKEVVLPESLTGIGEYAFDGCSALEKIWIDQTVTMIGGSAFSGCSKLTIHGVEGSYAQEYAEANSIPFSTELMVYPSTAITGSVKDTDGKGVSGVTVTLYDMTKGERQETIVTDKSGVWSSEDAIIGHTYQLWFYHTDYDIANNAQKYTIGKEPVTVPAVAATAKTGVPETVVEDYTYTVLNGTYCRVTGYKGTAGAIRLPSEIDGYIVQSVGDNVFKDNKTLVRVAFPETIETIGNSVFMGCTALTDVSFNEGLVSTGGSTFQGCTSLKKITMPGSIKSIGNSDFSGCTGLTEVNLPEGLTTIYAYAFQNCNGLTRIDIPDSVTTMSARAFYNCANLSEVGYPVGWTKLLDHSYNSDTYWSDGNSYYTSPFEGCSSLKKIEIPEGVTGIPKHAFRSFKSLEEVVLPESLTSIGVYAFDGCSGLATIKIPQNLKTIGSYAFQGCTGLRNINLNEGLGTIESCAFQGCTGLRNVTIPKSITSISGYVFSGCTGLTEVNLPEGLATIYAYAFQNCNGLTRIDIPDSVTTMSARAFYNCANLSEVGYPVGWTKLLDHSYNSDTYWSDGNSYYTSPFEGCSSLKKIEIPEGVTGIPKHAFRYLKSLEEVVLPESLTGIGVYAFDGCSALRTINLPEGLTTIPAYAFQNCTSMNILTLPVGITSIGNCAFYGCKGLRLINMNENLKTIGQYAFYGCSGLVSLVLREGLETISDYAFTNCTNLTAVEIPRSINSMATNSFNSCGKLKIYCYSGTAAHIASESAGYSVVLLDEHEHQFETMIETAPTCTRGGSQILTCTICGYNYIEVLEPLGHREGEWEITEAACIKGGVKIKHCTVCHEELAREIIPPTGHEWGEWIVESEASVLTEGRKVRTCANCEKAEEIITPKVQIDIAKDLGYGMAKITVVDATTKEVIPEANVFITTETEGEVTLKTDQSGVLNQILPVGMVKLSVYAPKYQTRNISVTIMPGQNELPLIGISKENLVKGELTSKEMTKEEMIEAGIDINDPSNQHKYKYELWLEFIPKIDLESLLFYVDIDGCPVVMEPGGSGGSGGSGNGKGYAWSIIYGGSGSGSGVGMKYTFDTGEVVSVYPVSERFFLIIYGEVHWLKEMYDVELLAINTSQTDTVENLEAELTLPEGLSLAKMVEGEQSLVQDIGTLAEGESKSVHWYVRGDKEGSYILSAALRGKMMPFGDTFEYTYETQEPLKVYAGSAMHLTFRVPDSAYYDEDYTVKIDLENVSDKTLYNVSHTITNVRQIRETRYSDGHVEIEEYPVTGGTGTIFIEEFNPGDVIHLEVTTTIMFQSKLLEYQMEKITKFVYGMEGLMEGFKTFSKGVELIGAIGDWSSGCSKAIDKFISTPGVTGTDKAILAGKLAKNINDLAQKCDADPSSQITKAIGQLKNAGTWEEVERIKKNPELLNSYSEKDLARLNTEIESARKKLLDKEFNPYDAVATAIELIPIKFVLVNSFVATVEDESTTVIPSTIIVEPTGARYFGVDSVSEYVVNLIKACIGKDLEAPKLAQFLGKDFKEDIGYYDAVEYVKVVENKAKEYNITATSSAGFRAWIERADTTARSVEEPQFDLSIDNETAQIDENGVLTFTGPGTLRVTPKGMENGVLCIEMEDGTVKRYNMEVVEQHECASDDWVVACEPGAAENGFKVKYCDICGEIIDMQPMKPCTHHEYSEFEEEQCSTLESTGVLKRTCIHCGCPEYGYTAADALNAYIYRFEEGTSVDEIKTFFEKKNILVSVPEADGAQAAATGMALKSDGQDYQLVISGDVNGDSEINVVDLQQLCGHINGVRKLTGAGLEASLSDIYSSEPELVDLMSTVRYLNGDR